MDFKTNQHKLVARICDFYQKNHLFDLGQVRATKLVYLIEYEYFGWEQRRFTDLDWIFWNYGPWSKTLSLVLTKDFHTPMEEEIAPGKFRPVHWSPPQFDKPKLKFGEVTLEGIIHNVLGRFAEMPYSELLDYVYFETEPMQNVMRGQTLDFSTISKAEPLVDAVSLLSPQVFHQLKKSCDELEIAETEVDFHSLTDAAILNSIANLDKEALFELPKGEVHINDESKTNLRKSFES